MKKERNLGRRFTARAVVLALITALVTPIAIATLAQPAAALAGDITTVAGLDNTHGYDGDGGAAAAARMNTPRGVSTDAQGNLLIADSVNHVVRVMAESSSNPGYPLSCPSACTWTVGDIFTVAGNHTAGYAGDGTNATTAKLNQPGDVAPDAAGNLLIADQSNHRVRIVAVSGSNPGYPLSGCSGACTWTTGFIFTVAGSDHSGYDHDGDVATNAKLNAPGNVALDSFGNVLIGDTGNGAIRVIAVSASNPGYSLAGHGCGGCTWTPTDIYTVAGGNGTGYGGDGGVATAGAAKLFNPHGVTTDATGNLLIADQNNARVRIVAVSASNPGYALAGCASTCTWTPQQIYTIAGTGVAGYNNDGVAATTAKLSSATSDVALDSSGNVIIADALNQRVRIVAESGSNPGYVLAGCGGACTWATGNIFTVAGTGSSGFSGDGNAATSAQLNFPINVAVDTRGNLLIADQGNDRIREVAVNVTSGLTVPAKLPNPGTAGYDTGYSVDNNITLSASGTWCNVAWECEGRGR